jgi:[NiFe] hydrogenase assembly HybE family chaperone
MSDAALDDPSARIEQAYEAIHGVRMRGLPFVNPRVRVEAVGFRTWEGQWLGALVTPWSLNLVLVPGEGPWTTLAAGAERFVDFPAGRFRFIAGREATLGESHTCSLFSPVLEFADHEAARLTAQAAMAGLFDTALPGRGAPAPLSKRDFLRGRFTGPGHADRG